VDRKKITEYLLCISHPDGSNKAVFFSQFGFTLENWKILAESLRKHGATYNVTKVVESEYGTRYSVDGLLETPDSRNPSYKDCLDNRKTVYNTKTDYCAPKIGGNHNERA